MPPGPGQYNPPNNLCYRRGGGPVESDVLPYGTNLLLSLGELTRTTNKSVEWELCSYQSSKS
eukprot:11520797-Prorocentrum_lima.AAC.1